MVERLLAKEEVASSSLVFRSNFQPEWRNWQTRQSQKLLRGDSRVGSTPTFGTMENNIAALCRGSTKDFESFYPGSIPGAAATNVLIALLLND